ncbi:hypothetical protein [Exiguobacterium sp. s102]|uniref:hypothetical protein n=1 Tax=Exiguobacterium sp. s102 TaxID=2751212 RepID=UPI001BEB0294|nr:hypothetical protein [Exiguobacterium sp. s102]
MKIAYYISDYGYGHATRSVAIIRELLKNNKNLNIIICHSFAQRFLKESLKDSRVIFRTLETDVGYILSPHTLELDHLKIQEMYEEYLINRKRKIKDESYFLTEQNIDYVISDIYPTAIEAAYDLNIPSIGISNFLWSDVYKNIISNSKLKIMRDAYAKMTHYLRLEGQINSNDYLEKHDFFSREIDHSEVEKIKFHLKVTSSDTVVFYGLGMKVDHSNQFDNNSPLWSTEGCKFIVSSHVDINHPNVFRIPYDYTETQNYIAASDFTITKPGWSTISEALNGSSRLMLLNRNSFLEDQSTIKVLKNSNYCNVYSVKELSKLQFDQKLINQLKKQIQLKDTKKTIDFCIEELQKKLKR